ncbi:hypothetical protein [Bacillus litorisediminis]|uniref:hypothetical protein n=1 Tax=Bacillus litorisediminis TaxID=2922713 RepID=UPI001FAE70C8|nr:hypothetical protein [Bacillus litorisediminis]
MPVLWILIGIFAAILVLAGLLDIYIKKTNKKFIPDRRRKEKDQAHLKENDPRRLF